jgi:hypothetical protein
MRRSLAGSHRAKPCAESPLPPPRHRCIASEAYVEVLYEGFAFRLHLTGDRDQAVAQQLQQAGQAQQGPPPLAHSWHHGLVSAIEGVNAAFGPSARLAQRWVGCHLMSSQLCDEAVELLVAAAFSSAGLQGVPGSRVAGGSSVLLRESGCSVLP